MPVAVTRWAYSCVPNKKIVPMCGDDIHYFLQNNQYRYLGQYTVMSITQGGCSVPFLAPPVYEYISTGKLPTDIEVNLKDIPDATLRFALQKV